MKNCNKQFIIPLVIVFVLILFIIGKEITKPDEIIQSNSEYILVKEYKLYNRDSTLCKYKQSVKYKAVVTNKEKDFCYYGMAKAKFSDSHFYITINGNNTIHRLEVEDYIYQQLNKNDTINVEENWYPYHRLIIYNNTNNIITKIPCQKFERIPKLSIEEMKTKYN